MSVFQDDLFKNRYLITVLVLSTLVIGVIWLVRYNSVESRCERYVQNLGLLLGAGGNKLKNLQLQPASEPLIRECVERGGPDPTQTSPVQTAATPQTSITNKISGNKISLVELDSSKCSLKVTTTNKVDLVGINDLGTKNPPCKQTQRFQISESKIYLALEDVSGGIDSMIKVYSAEHGKTVQLYVFGTSSIFDFIFLPGDFLAVTNGYPGLPDEQYLNIYNIASLFADYPTNLHPEYNLFENLAPNDKSVELPKHTEDISELTLVQNALEVGGKTKTLARFSVADLTNFSDAVIGVEAEGMVRALPEVKGYLSRVKEGKVEIDYANAKKDSWVVHVYESLPTHTATFNWYYVNKATGEVIKEFNFE